MKNVLMTGVGGFVGSHCLDYFLNNTDWKITGLDSFRHKGTCLRVRENVPNGYEDRVNIFRHDLAVPIDPQLESLLLKNGKIDLIINLASESAVERSTSDPVSCLRNNYDLMINMLEFARRIKPNLFIQFSTDEVYGEASPSESHKEWSTIMPSNPYCLLPGTKIITKHGLINIEDFDPIKHRCLSRQRSKIVKATATKKFQYDYKGDVYTISTGTERISCTAQHKFFKFETFYTEHENTIGCSKKPHVRIVECCADKLSVGDEILIARKIPTCNSRWKNINEKLYRFLGYYVGDGHKNKRDYIFLTDEKKDYLIFYKKLLQSLLGVSKHSATGNFGHIVKHSTKNCHALQFKSKKMNDFIKDYNKTEITNSLLGNEIQNIKEFIAGFFDAEAHYRIEGKKLVSITAYQKNIKILEVIKFLLRNIGVVGKIEEQHRYNKITKKTYCGWRLNITDATSLKIISEEIHSLKIVSKTRKPQRKNRKKAEHRRYRVTKIEKSYYEGAVYDLECPANHNYIANYFVVHNSASKAAQEALAISYWRTYDMPIIITNGMNIIGERQDSEKFLPKIIQCVANGMSVPIYGDSPQSIGSRTYIHGYNVGDALAFLSNKKPALYEQFASSGETYLAKPDRYNVCGSVELNNLELAQLIAKIMGKELKYHIVPSESARKGYDRRYALDGSKLRELGWVQTITLQESLERIVMWSLENPHWLV